MSAQRFRKKPVEIEAMQWDGSDRLAEALYEWSLWVVSRNADGRPHAVSTQFMVLGEDDAYEVFGCYDEGYELLPDNEVDDRIAGGYSAVVYDRLHGTWVNVKTGQWIIRGIEGEFYPCDADVFAATYEAVADV